MTSAGASRSKRGAGTLNSYRALPENAQAALARYTTLAKQKSQEWLPIAPSAATRETSLAFRCARTPIMKKGARVMSRQDIEEAGRV